MVGWSISSGVGLCACQVHNTFEMRSKSITELFPRTSFDSLLSVYRLVTGCSGKLYFFPRILIKLPLLPAFGCKENVQPIGPSVQVSCEDEWLSFIQGMACKELGKTQHPLAPRGPETYRVSHKRRPIA